MAADTTATMGEDIWEDCPLFAPSEVTVPKLDEKQTAEGLSPAMGALSHLLYDEETPLEKSEHLRDEGNRRFKRGRKGYRGAISKYSDAIIAAADVPEALAPAYLNRSVAEYKLSNFGRALADAEQSLHILPGNAKAHYRAMFCAVNLGKFDDALRHCDHGIALLSRESSDRLKADLRVFRQQRKEIEKSRETLTKREVERGERAQKEDEKRQALELMMQSCKVKRGLPLFAQQRRYPNTHPVEKHGVWYWPVLLIYPEEVVGPGLGDQSDFIGEVAENAAMRDILGSVFAEDVPPPAWDTNRMYCTAQKLEVLFRADWTMRIEDADSDEENNFCGSMLGRDELGHWTNVSPSSTLREVLARRDYIMPMFPVFYVVPTGTHLT